MVLRQPEGALLMIIDTDKVQALLDDSTITYRDIEKNTGYSKGALHRYRSGQLPVENMQIKLAKKLQDYYVRIRE